MDPRDAITKDVTVSTLKKQMEEKKEDGDNKKAKVEMAIRDMRNGMPMKEAAAKNGLTVEELKNLGGE